MKENKELINLEKIFQFCLEYSIIELLLRELATE